MNGKKIRMIMLTILVSVILLLIGTVIGMTIYKNFDSYHSIQKQYIDDDKTGSDIPEAYREVGAALMAQALRDYSDELKKGGELEYKWEATSPVDSIIGYRTITLTVYLHNIKRIYTIIMA